MREENGVKVFTDMKAFYRYIQYVEYDIYIDVHKNVWNKNEIIARYEFN
ncbi:hypothetical protein [Petrimonas sulfuriphila]